MYNPKSIIELLNKKHLNRAELSRGAELSASTIAYILSPSGNPTADKLEKIADFLECSIDVFFERQCSSVEYSGNEELKTTNNVDEPLEEYKDKYLLQLENENKRLNEELARKQVLIDSFLSGKVIVGNKSE